jgi:hypothetical protein
MGSKPGASTLTRTGGVTDALTLPLPSLTKESIGRTGPELEIFTAAPTMAAPCGSCICNCRLALCNAEVRRTKEMRSEAVKAGFIGFSFGGTITPIVTLAKPNNSCQYRNLPVNACDSPKVTVLLSVLYICGLAPTDLANTVCELLGWKRAIKKLKKQECVFGWTRLEQLGLITRSIGL